MCDWNIKVELVKLGNQANNPELRKVFNEYVLYNHKNFDEQAWSMFINITDINKSKIIEDKDYWLKLLYTLNNINNKNELPLRENIRLEMIIGLINEIEQ